MKKYYFNNILIRKSNNDYAYAVGCIIGDKFKVFGCHRNLALAKTRFIETKRALERNYKSWATPDAIAYFGDTVCAKKFNSIKFQFDNLMIIKLEVK